MAQAWQTPEVGEQVVAAMTGASRADRLAMFEGLGMPGSIAEAHADAVDEAMGACVLTFTAAPCRLRFRNLGPVSGPQFGDPPCS